MRAWPPLIALALCLAGSSARAVEGGGIADDFATNAQAKTRDNPRNGSVSDTLSGVLEVTESLALNLAVAGTYSLPTRAVADTAFGTRGGAVWTIAPGLDWDMTEHFSLSLSLSISPRSTLLADSTVAITRPGGAATDVDVLLSSRTTSQAFNLLAAYDTAGDSRAETSVALSVGGLFFETTQSVIAARLPDGSVISAADLAAQCPACSRQFTAAARRAGGPDAFLGQFSLAASVVETLFHDTDLGLGFTYYLYTRDPTEVGYFSLTTVGQTGVSFGSGVPLAPVQWSLRPEVAQRFGRFSIRLTYLHQQYVDGEGQGNSLVLKLQFKFNTSWKAYVIAGLARDRDIEGNNSDSLTLGAGLHANF